MAFIPSSPPIASPIGESVAILTARLKNIAKRKSQPFDTELIVLTLLKGYLNSLRKGVLRRLANFHFEKANPYANFPAGSLDNYHLAMQSLYTLKPFNVRLLRFSPLQNSESKSGKTNIEFLPYNAAFATLPFINFTPLCLFSPALGSFYIYPSFILCYAPAAHLHEPVILPLKQGHVNFSVLQDPSNTYSRIGTILEIALWNSNLTLRFSYSPRVVQLFGLFGKHCLDFQFPVEAITLKSAFDNPKRSIFHLVDYLHRGVSHLPTLADRMQLDLSSTIMVLTEAYFIKWYSIDEDGTPNFAPLSCLQYLRRAIQYNSVTPETTENDTLLAQLSPDYFTAALFYVNRAFQLANTALTAAPTLEQRSEGVLLDLFRIAFTINGYNPRPDLVSLPILQALFLTLLPNSQLTLQNFKIAYRKWPHALLFALSIFKRQDYFQKFADSDFYTIKYAALASQREAMHAADSLRSIAELMFSCCKLKTQKNSKAFFKLHAALVNSYHIATTYEGLLPVAFDYAKIVDSSTVRPLIPILNHLPHLKVSTLPPNQQEMPLLFFIYADYSGTLPFLFYETALRTARLPGHSFHFAQSTIDLNRINIQELSAAFLTAKSGVLVLNVTPLLKAVDKKCFNNLKAQMAQLIAIAPPKVIFVTFISFTPVQRLVAVELLRHILYQPIVLCPHVASIENFAYIFQRIAAFYQINITNGAVQTLVARLGKSRAVRSMLFLHAVPLLLSFFRRTLLAYADRLNRDLRNPHANHSLAIIAEDIQSVKFIDNSL